MKPELVDAVASLGQLFKSKVGRLSLLAYLLGVGAILVCVRYWGVSMDWIGWVLLVGWWILATLIGVGDRRLLIFRFLFVAIFHFLIKWSFLLAFAEIPRWATSIWIDFLVLGITLRLALDFFRKDLTILRWRLPDILVVIWIGLGVCFFFYSDTPMDQRVYGVRMTYYPILFYILARLDPRLIQPKRFLRFGAEVLVFLGIINIGVLLFVSQEWLRSLHKAIESAPSVFWIGKYQFLRASSMFASPVEFGSFLVLGTVACLVFWKWSKLLLWCLLLFFLLNLFWTGSTGAILALIVSGGLLLLVNRSYGKILLLVGITVILFLIPQFDFFIRNKLNFREIYGRSAPGVTYLSMHPWGQGVGASGHSILRFVDEQEEGFFTDLTRRYWAYPHIKALWERGHIAGCATDPLRFCPEDDMTRIQLAVLLTRLHSDLHKGASIPPTGTFAVEQFSDIRPDFELLPFVEYVTRQGFMENCPDHPGTFCPFDSMTRAEVAPILVRAKGWEGAYPEEATFGDVPKTSPYWPYIERLYEEGITGGYFNYPVMRFAPDMNVTRAQGAVYLVNIFEIPHRSEDVLLLSVTDSWYVKTATEVGIQGLLVFLSLLISFCLIALRSSLEGFEENFVKFVALAVAGISLQGIGSNIWDFFLLPHVIWLLMGVSITLVSRPRLSGGVQDQSK